jgi:hypothetical protein
MNDELTVVILEQQLLQSSCNNIIIVVIITIVVMELSSIITVHHKFNATEWSSHCLSVCLLFVELKVSLPNLPYLAGILAVLVYTMSHLFLTSLEMHGDKYPKTVMECMDLSFPKP